MKVVWVEARSTSISKKWPNEEVKEARLPAHEIGIVEKIHCSQTFRVLWHAQLPINNGGRRKSWSEQTFKMAGAFVRDFSKNTFFSSISRAPTHVEFNYQITETDESHELNKHTRDNGCVCVRPKSPIAIFFLSFFFSRAVCPPTARRTRSNGFDTARLSQ